MYAMCHVLSGAMLGSYLSARRGERRLVPAGIAGSVLLNPIANPPGLVLTGTVGYGRISLRILSAVPVLCCASGSSGVFPKTTAPVLP
ncbi:MAG: hypothetical protein QFX32_06580 [Methanolinea sp.]|nr:hypothetical protein [Methanolinea sp.]